MQACRLRPTIGYSNTAQNRFRSAFGINDINVEIAVFVKNAAVIQLKGRLLAAAAAVFLHQLLVGKWTLGILVTVMQVAVSGRSIQIKIGFLNIFAMIAFVTGKAKSAFFKNDRGLPVSPGTVASGLQSLLPLFTPVYEAWYQKQMTERLFFNDETRWEVFEAIESKVGWRWYLWLTRSASVIYYVIDPSRSAAVPGAHFKGLSQDRVIIVCDRYSAYKKLARLLPIILLAFCWAHVRRDFLNAGKAFAELADWAVTIKKHIGTLYHLNKERLMHWNPERGSHPFQSASEKHNRCSLSQMPPSPSSFQR